MLSLDKISNIVKNSKHLHIVGSTNNSAHHHSVEQLDMSQYSGIIEYYPEELVITVKAGTSIKQINQVLSENKQVTSFDINDDEHNHNKTIGGAYANGNADLRDAVLGIKIIDGQGRLLTFGGQVIKNVAGYDVARLLVGSKGRLAIICEISFKVIPKNHAKIKNHKTISTLKNNDVNSSAVKEKIEQGLKNIFDPNGVFI